MRRKAACGLLALASAACGKTAAPAFPLRPVFAAEIARGPEAATQPPQADLRERVRSLVVERAHAIGKLRVLALADVKSIGEPAVPVVDELLDETGRDRDEQVSALETLGALDTASSADALAKRVNLEKYRDRWLRAQAAYQLTKGSSDHVVPALLVQLKYEIDGETVVWIARALANHRNYAGLVGLRVLAAEGATPEVRSLAQDVREAVAKEAGFPDADALEAAWSGPDPERKVPREDPSPRLRLATWRRIADLAAFDLRLVDDARFALSRSGGWVADLLAAALHDEDAHVRVHVAQSLERMGPRGSGACGELAAALDEPAVAAGAAAALGSLRCAGARAALVARLTPENGADLRNASAAALGRLGEKEAIPALRTLLLPSEPLDLRQTAAQALVDLGESGDAVLLLAACLTEPGGDPGGAETVLERWLSREAAVRPELAAVLERWRSLSGDTARRPARAELLRSSVAAR